jgi:hypothetical protein
VAHLPVAARPPDLCKILLLADKVWVVLRMCPQRCWASDGGRTEMAKLRIMQGDPGFMTWVKPGAHGGAGRGAQVLHGGAGQISAPVCPCHHHASLLKLSTKQVSVSGLGCAPANPAYPGPQSSRQVTWHSAQQRREVHCARHSRNHDARRRRQHRSRTWNLGPSRAARAAPGGRVAGGEQAIGSGPCGPRTGNISCHHVL